MGRGAKNENSAEQPDAKAIRESAASYVEAINQGDLVAAASTGPGGRLRRLDGSRGQVPFARQGSAGQGGEHSELAVQIDSIRRVTADVAIVEGSARRSTHGRVSRRLCQPLGGRPLIRSTGAVRIDGRWSRNPRSNCSRQPLGLINRWKWAPT